MDLVSRRRITGPGEPNEFSEFGLVGGVDLTPRVQRFPA